MRRSPLPHLLALVAMLAATAPRLSAQALSRDGAMEKLTLFDPADVKAWSPAESTVAATTEHARGSAATMHWQVIVDYTTGEAKYPIGWPRVGRSLPAGPARNWSGWDYLHCWIYVATNRERLPSVPAGLGLHTPDRAGAYQLTLAELKAGEWVELKLPIAEIPRNHDVRQIQFHIAEANYRDGDRLDFFLSDLALLRYAAPTLLAATPESAVLFADAARIPVRLHLAGLKPGQQAEVRCELFRDGRVAAHATASCIRGVQTAMLALGSQSLAPGDYELRSNLGGQTQPKIAHVRLVASPWK